MERDIVRQAASFIQDMKAGQQGVFPHRLSGEELHRVRTRLRRAGLSFSWELNPTAQGGGMQFYRQEGKRRPL